MFSMFVGEPPVMLYDPVVANINSLFFTPIIYLLCAMLFFLPLPLPTVNTVADQRSNISLCAFVFKPLAGAVIMVVLFILLKAS